MFALFIMIVFTLYLTSITHLLPYRVYTTLNRKVYISTALEMKEEPIWKVGPVKRRIHRRLQQILRLVEQSPDLYLNSTLSGKANIRKQDWDLTDKDEFFACMTEEDFANLTPSDPLEDMEPYEATESPDSAPPRTVFELERSAIEIELWFKELQRRKVSEDGCGCAWPDNSSAWVPREKFRFEDLYGGSRMPPSVPWRLFSAYYNDDKPHQIYHAWHGDEGREEAILRSELQILIRCMKGRMADSALSVHNVPVSSPISATTHATEADSLPGPSPFHPRSQSPNHDCPLQRRHL